MTTVDPETDLDTRSGELTRLIRTIPGVIAVYSSKPLLKTAIATVVEKIRHDSIGTNLVSLVPRATGIDVIATVGVAEEDPARDVCERVYVALNDHFLQRPVSGDVTIRVRIGRVG